MCRSSLTMLPPRISSPASLQHILHEGWKLDNVLPLLESPQPLPLHTESNPSPLLWPIEALAWLSPGQLHTRCKDLISVPQTSNFRSQTQAITIAVPTQQLHFHFSLSCIGEGNGNPLQCSCLENPRDEGAWWAAVYGVRESQTRLKWLSSSSYLENFPVPFSRVTVSHFLPGLP